MLPFGHHGSAGSGLFVDKERDFFVIYLTNFRHYANILYDKEPYDFGPIERGFRSGIPNSIKIDLEEQSLIWVITQSLLYFKKGLIFYCFLEKIVVVF